MDIHESLEIVKVKTLYKDEQQELKETTKKFEQKQSEFENKNEELVNELIDENRKLMMNIRSCNQEYKQYDVISEQFDSAFIGITLKKRDIDRMKKKEDKAEKNAFRKRQKILSQCKY
jgi:hypothetical protein